MHGSVVLDVRVASLAEEIGVVVVRTNRHPLIIGQQKRYLELRLRAELEVCLRDRVRRNKEGITCGTDFARQFMLHQHLRHPVDRFGAPFKHMLPKSQKHDLPHCEIPESSQVTHIARFIPKALAAHAVGKARLWKYLIAIQVVSVIANRRRQTRFGCIEMRSCVPIQMIDIVIAMPKSIDILRILSQMRSKSDVMRKRAKVVTFCKYMRRNQRRRLQRNRRPLISNCLEDPVEVSKQA